MKKKLLKSACCKYGIERLLRIMKITFFLLLLGFLQLSAVTYSQNAKLDISFREASLREIFEEIEKQSECRFLFRDNIIDSKQHVTINMQGTVNEILKELAKDNNIKFEILKNNLVVISSSVPSNSSEQQQKSVSGKVTDSSGSPLPGVSVVIKSMTKGVITDINGSYSIANVPANAILVFSFVGMKTQEILVSGKTAINVTLIEETVGLEEVVAVGYGTQKKINLTGSVGGIKGESLVGSSSTNAISSLQGRLAGVNITQNTGRPGREDISVLIRGIGTMNNASPMYIVDGVESDMSDINPHDIESINVLKDAAAAAIYGTRAANGVILVTTKRGKKGFNEITFSSSYGFQKPTNLTHALGSADYAELYNEGQRNEGLPERYTAEAIEKYRSGVDPYNYPNTDWLDLLITKSGFTQDQNLSFLGGNDITSYRTSLGYYNQDGLMKNSNHERYNARINIDSKIKEWFNMGVNVGISNNIVKSPVSPFSQGEEFFRQTNCIPSTIANKNADGTWNRYTDGNPIAWIEAGGLNKTNDFHLLGSIFGELKLAQGLTIKGVAGINYYLDDNKKHVTEVQYGDGSVQGPNSVTDDITRQGTVSLQSLLNYERQFKKHGIKLLLGASREAYTYKYNSAYRNNFPSNLLEQLSSGSSTSMTNSGSSVESRLGSFFGRINYDYNKRYLFEANLRRDASSKFAKDNRVGWFPSVSVGWRLSEEAFMKNISWISNLKLRTSWGQLGNHNIGDYLYIQRITLGENYNFGGKAVNGASTTVASNSAISWEKTSEFDLGLDVDLFHNRLLSFSADYYNRYTDDILTTVPVSMVFGLGAPTVNAGAMRNKGVEILLEHNNKIRNFQYSLSFNFAYNDNKVERYANPSKGTTICAEGISWNSFYGYKAIGIYQTDAEAAASAHITGVTVKAGDLIYKDQDNSGAIDGNDRVVLGNSIPKITFGSNINLKYKNIDLIVFLQGAAKVYRTLGGECFWPFDAENASTIHLDRTIVKDGVVVKQGHYPRTVIHETGNRAQSSFSVLDASYLRLKNIQLGYTLPKSWLKTVKLSKARIYISGQNLLTLCNFPTGYDPEMPVDGGNNSYPHVKFYTFGFDVTF